jgi:hypothetical protein
MSYRPRHFILQELVGPQLYAACANNPDYLWRKLNARILEAADIVRGFYGVPVIINNWHNGGRFKESGLRDMNTTTGAKLSAHKFGLALDLKLNVPIAKIHKDIKSNRLPIRFYECVNVVEINTPTWLHVAFENHMKGGIMWVRG